ncbi:hypothetical protein BDN72DRAFT_841814, partial [Pluteus cervinus]
MDNKWLFVAALRFVVGGCFRVVSWDLCGVRRSEWGWGMGKLYRHVWQLSWSGLQEERKRREEGG